MQRRAKVLLVDDEPVVRDLVRQVLASSGSDGSEVPLEAPEVELVETSGSEQAVAAWRESGPFDVALVDKNLPDGDGLDLIARLKGQQADAEAILITAYPSFESAVTALRAGAYDYLTKPFSDVNQLRLKVHNAIERRWLKLTRGELTRELDASETQRMRAERDRADLEEELRRSQKIEALGRLAGGIAHDFNNLLVPILNYGDFMTRALEQLESEVTDERHRELLESLLDFSKDIAEAGKSAAQLTRQLLSFSRDEVVAPQRLSVGEVVSTVERLIRRTGGEHIEIESELPDELWPVLAERSQLEQLLMNLCVNACEAMSGGGTLSVGAKNADVPADQGAALGLQPGRYVLLWVADTGPGIPERILEHIYEPFFTTKEEGGGTGLGLATAYRIAEQHGGKMHVWSKLDRGSTFHIYLPIAGEREAGAASPERPEEPELERRELPDGRGETVLVVEDDERVRRLVRRVLTAAGYRVLEASQGEEGWSCFQRHRDAIDLVLTDVIMPKLRGRELMERIRGVRGDVGVVYMSAYAVDTAVQRDLSGDRVTFLAKPFKDGQLLDALRRALEPSG